jgi:hypothetical protein
MPDTSENRPESRRERDTVERLARETNTPLDRVSEIYRAQADEIRRTARIKTYIDVLATQKTRNILNSMPSGS